MAVGKKAFGCISFLMMLCALLVITNGILMPRDEPIEALYEQRVDSIDVLFLGSSHVYSVVDTGTLWDEQGIADYDLGASRVPFWNTYFYLKEALKTQHPKLIVLDVYRAIEANEYVEQKIVSLNINGMQLNENKLEAIAASTDQKVSNLLGWPIHHNRYVELQRKDFSDDAISNIEESWKGYTPFFHSYALEENPDLSLTDAYDPLSEKTEEYLRKIIELARDHDIPILLINAPYPSDQSEQAVFNSIAAIAAEYDIPYLSSDELFRGAKLDFTGEETDLGDSSHLNYKGSRSYSSFLGRYIRDNYDIPDDRGQEEYGSWQINADNIRAQIDDHAITRTSGFLAWFDEIINEKRFTAVLNIPASILEDDEIISVLSLLRGCGLELTNADAQDGFIVILQGGDIIASSSNPDFLWHDSLSSDELMVKGAGSDAEIRLGYASYPASSDGLTALLYDDLAGSLVEVAFWSAGNLDERGVAEEAS